MHIECELRPHRGGRPVVKDKVRSQHGYRFKAERRRKYRPIKVKIAAAGSDRVYASPILTRAKALACLMKIKNQLAGMGTFTRLAARIREEDGAFTVTVRLQIIARSPRLRGDKKLRPPLKWLA